MRTMLRGGWRVVAAGALLSMLVAASARADPTPVGLWHQVDDRTGGLRSVIRLVQVGDELEGIVLRPILRPGEPDRPTCERCPGELRGRPIEGLRFMWGLRGGGREWDDGRVLDPEDGKIYRVRLRLSADGNTLEVRGYVGISLFGRSQRWTRAPEEASPR